MTKRENIDNPNSCWNKAKDDEFVFILLERDPVITETIQEWIQLRTSAGVNNPADDKIIGAMKEVIQIEKRREEKTLLLKSKGLR